MVSVSNYQCNSSCHKADGVTEIHNVAKEPEIVDIVSFLNSMGAKIQVLERMILGLKE